ncbi:dihydroorotase [Nocardioides hungaricus]
MSGTRLLRGLSLYGEQEADVRLEAGRIVEIGPQLDGYGAVVVDCAGLIGLPAFVDLHTHLREPGPGGAETMATGTAAAVAGGYAAVFAMANTDPVADSVAIVEEVARRAETSASCAVYPVGAVTVGLAGQTLTPIEDLAASAAAVRVFSDDGHCVADPVLMREALGRIGAVGGVLAQHAQSPELSAGGQVNAGAAAEALGLPPWPGVAEEVIVARDLVLAAEGAPRGARLHICHVSTAESVELLRWAKQRGLPVTAEVTPHHLALVDTATRGSDTRFKVNPPLRTEEDREAVRRALAEGVIDVIATDHAPHSAEAKARRWCDAPPGMLGLETALGVVAATMVETGRMTWRDVAASMSERPARIGGVGSRHGRGLAVGEPATLCLVDPRETWSVVPGELSSIGKNTPFEAMSLPARVVATVIAGRVAFDRRELFDRGE